MRVFKTRWFARFAKSEKIAQRLDARTLEEADYDENP